MSMRDSITSVSKHPLRESQLIDRLNEPLSSNSIKLFSNPTSMSTVGTKTHLLKIKKYQSLETNSTDSDALLSQEIKFVTLYKGDLIFRKKVDILIKQHQKRMKQKEQNYSLPQPGKSFPNHSWRMKKQSDQTNLLEMYQKCKKWIVKATQPQ